MLANDADTVEGSAVTAVLVAGPAHGTLTLNSDGSFSYVPAADYNGSDSFTYRASDGDARVGHRHRGDYDRADARRARRGERQLRHHRGHDAGDVRTGRARQRRDVDGNPLTAILVSGPSHGALTLNANGGFTYTPDVNYSGPDSFTYKANDGAGDSNVATVEITVNGVNDVPVAGNNTYSTPEDVTLVVGVPGVLGNDSDGDGNPLSVIVVSFPTHGTLLMDADGEFTYTPAANYNGPDSFTYRANDGTVNSNLATVTITVSSVNDPPVARARQLQHERGHAVGRGGPGLEGQ